MGLQVHRTRRRADHRSSIVYSCAVIAFVASVASTSAAAATTGENIRAFLGQMHAECKERKLGPYLDPTDRDYKRKRATTDCDLLQLKPFDLAAILATPEVKAVYAIQLPPPLDKPRVEYSRWMTAERYFKALCEKESGDFVFKTAEGVDRVLQMRLSLPASRYRLGSYSEEMPGEQFFAVDSKAAAWLVPDLYTYFEIPVPASVPGMPSPSYQLFFHDPSVPKTPRGYRLESKLVDKPAARYAYAWRGVEREHARELGIVGGELIVVDLLSNKVMAVRRDFALYQYDRKIPSPIPFSATGCRSAADTGFHFLARVLKPMRK